MSYEIVSNIGFNKKEEKITVSSYSSNVVPKISETWTYGKDDMTLDEKIESIVKSMIGRSLKLNYSTVSPFTRAYALALEKVAKNENISIKDLYKDISKIVWYLPDYDPESEKPTVDSNKRLKSVCKYLKDFLYTTKSKDDPKVGYKIKKSQKILHYSIYGM